MLIQKAFKYRLKKPNWEIKNLCRRYVGCCRFVYNKALAIQKERWDKGEKLLSYTELANLLPIWKQDPALEFLKEAPAQALQQALKNLERAFKNFFEKRAGVPKFHRRGHNDTFRFPEPKQFVIDEKNSRIKLPKLGWVRYHNSRLIIGTPRNITVSVEADGFFVSIQTQFEIADPQPINDSQAGLDLGVVRLATMSDGEVFESIDPKKSKKLNRKLRRLQKALARKREVAKKQVAKEKGEKGQTRVKYGKNYQKNKAELAKHHRTIANIRKDNVEKASTTISKKHAFVAVEALKTKNMTASAAGTLEEPGRNVKAKSGLNRAILNQGWGMFRVRLKQKMTVLGGEVVEVPPQYTSQRCPKCENIDKGNRKTQADFKCLNCGYTNNADVVGAINILWRSGRPSEIALGRTEAQAPPMNQEPTEETNRGLSLLAQ